MPEKANIKLRILPIKQGRIWSFLTRPGWEVSARSKKAHE
jgi:hypothetical protein